ncbi:MAG: hypothetical protein O3C05_02070 [Proteobacteria bacterium]|nr:hypothetical protein [Pseudomonadota bacterium]
MLQLSVKRSFYFAICFGFFAPFLVIHYIETHDQEAFSAFIAQEFVFKIISLSLITIPSSFIFAFLLLLLKFRCPNCKAFWKYDLVEKFVLSSAKHHYIIPYFRRKIIYTKQECIDKLECMNCSYSHKNKCIRRSIDKITE